MYSGISGRVVSAAEDDSGKFIYLRIRGKQPLPVPAIQYFPGASGQTVMAVDFPGLIWDQPSSVIRTKNQNVDLVRVGQFQADPPVFRISITTSNAAMLRKIDLQVDGEGLKVRFPSSDNTSSLPEQRNNIDVEQSSRKMSSDSRRREIAPSYIPPVAPNRHASILSDLDRAVSKMPGRTASEMPVLRPPMPEPELYARQKSEVAPVVQKPRVRPGTETKPKDDEPVAESNSVQVESQQRKGTGPLARLASALPPLAPAFRRRPATASNGEEQKSVRSDRSERVEVASPQGAPDFRQLKAPANPKLERLVDRPRMEEPPRFKQNEEEPRRLARLGTSSVDERDNRDSSKPLLEPVTPISSSLSFAGVQPLQLVVRGAGPMKYRSFRLSDPERYVVDFIEGAPSLDMGIPESPARNVLSSVRTGMPDSENASVRLVLDLAKSGIAVKEKLGADANSLTLTLSESEELLEAKSGRFTVVIDAGHGGSDPGAQRGDLREKDMTLAIAMRLKRNLESKGLRVIMTRSDDTFVSLEERVRITNAVKPDAFVSVHINSLESDSAICGIETYYQNDSSQVLAQKIHESLVGKLAVPDRRVRKARFYVVNHTPHPAILAEVGFISNKQEREKLMSSDYQVKVAEALGQGIIYYLSSSRNLSRKGAEERKSAELPPLAPAKNGASSVAGNIITR